MSLLASIQKGVVERPPRIVLCGVEKIGKTTFAAGAPAPVFIPIRGEEGNDALDVARFPTVTTYAEMIDAIGALISEDHPYETVVIDSVSTLEPLIWEHVCKEAKVEKIEDVGGGFGKGYVMALDYWRDIMAGLDALRDKGVASIVIGHVKVKTFQDPTTSNYDNYVLDVNEKAASALMRWSDAILFARNRVFVKQEDAGFNKKSKKATGDDNRCLYTQKRPAHPGGGRGVYGQLPYELPLSWEAYQEAITAAKAAK